MFLICCLERRQGGGCCKAVVQESDIDTAVQLKDAANGFTDDAQMAELVRKLIKSMNQ